MADECHGALDLPTESLDFTHGFSWTLQTDLLEAVEESPDEICGTKKTWCDEGKAWEWANTRKSYWHTANSWILSTTLNNDTLRKLGRTCLEDGYH